MFSKFSTQSKLYFCVEGRRKEQQQQNQSIRKRRVRTGRVSYSGLQITTRRFLGSRFTVRVPEHIGDKALPGTCTQGPLDLT